MMPMQWVVLSGGVSYYQNLKCSYQILLPSRPLCVLPRQYRFQLIFVCSERDPGSPERQGVQKGWDGVRV